MSVDIRRMGKDELDAINENARKWKERLTLKSVVVIKTEEQPLTALPPDSDPQLKLL